ncbi:MAG: HDOD domain-containing protein [Kofleriaceae bacterium]
MTRILFVDDEPIVLRALDRAIRVQRRPWKAVFVSSGKDALELLQREQFDVIVSDIGMPVMDGVTLLHNVRERFPHMARLALSGEARSDERMRAVLAIHQWLAKPCPLAKLVDTIDRLSWARTLIDDPEMVAKVCGLASLPSAPTLYLEVAEALEHTDDLDQIATLIETDMAIARELLQLVNSAFFTEAERVTSVRRAAAMLGADRLRELLLAAEIFRSRPAAADLAAHAVYVAKLARSFAHEHHDDVFVAGLLHDVAKLAVGEADSSSPVFLARLGGLLLGTWGLPAEVINAVAFHHDPEAAPDPNEQRLLIVALAEALANEHHELADRCAVSLGHDPAECRARAAAIRPRPSLVRPAASRVRSSP